MRARWLWILVPLGLLVVPISCSIGMAAGAMLGGQGRIVAGPRVQVVRLEGAIMDQTEFMKDLLRARDDERAKAIVVRIESPGGAVGASQEIFDAIRAVDRVKPVVASIGNIGASGGYYAALGARRIFANPGSLTGSIGVITQFPEVHGLLDKLGVGMRTVRSGDLKDAGSPFRPMDAQERAYFQGVVDDIYRQFRGAVAARRKLDSARLDSVADGRVLSGHQALQAGLIDSLGGLQDAIGSARRLAGLPADAAVDYDEPEKSLLQRLADPQGRVGQALEALGSGSVEYRYR